MGGLSGVGDPGNAGAERPEHRWRWQRWRQLFLRCAVCLALLLPAPGLHGQAQAISWPRRAGPAATPQSLGVSSTQRLQEVPPPAAVQQLQEALADRAPRVRILTPAADAVLPGEPWSLRLQVDDWPLVDGGALGLGPHLLVQIDGEEPLRLTELETTLPPLSPGSHRLTVVAARPWGEVVKSPGALAQIRLHRTAPNPLSLPAVGSPQLLPVSPPPAAAGEPLLLDWLLVDAPLQHLRDDDARWRLRVTINGDSFLMDRQTPLWLRGWRPGTNAVQLELLDGRGEPLNPPFNSLVQDVRLDRDQPRPAWLGERLSSADLAVLLGQAPPAPEIKAEANTPGQSEDPIAGEGPSPEPAADRPETVAPQSERAESGAESFSEAEEEAEAEAQEEPEAEPEEEAEAAPSSPAADPRPATGAPDPAAGDGAYAAEPASEPEAATPAPVPSDGNVPSAPLETDEPAADEPAAAAPTLRPAREEVNADGTLRREPRRGPLAGLRERLAG